jgi:hypothetical protein
VKKGGGTKVSSKRLSKEETLEQVGIPKPTDNRYEQLVGPPEQQAERFTAVWRHFWGS